MDLRIPYYTLKPQHDAISQEANQAFAALINKGEFILGAQVQQFEEELAAWLGVQRTAGMGNGSDALYSALVVMGVGRGDEVIVPAHTCVATWMAVSRTGAKIVPVDVSPETWLISADAIEPAITDKTKAIVPVHLYGSPCNMATITQLAQSKKLFVIEDNAQAIGATFDGRKTGTWGVCNAFSFYPTKNLGALGDGGALVTDDERAWQRATSFRNYGSVRSGVDDVPGINSRLDEMQAAVLRIKLRQLKTWTEQRRQIASWYQHHLNNADEVTIPKIVFGGQAVYHIFPIAVAGRDSLRKYLESKGVGTSVHYPLAAQRQHHYKESDIKGSFPIADQLADKQISLPIWPGMKEVEVVEVCDLIKKFFSKPASTR
jgi:dTDP-4-amino-4,6-dideoxygalactose transaminase